MRNPLRVPAVLTVTALSLGSLQCASSVPPAPVDASADRPSDVTVSDASDVTDVSDVADVGDACPDPAACYTDFRVDDGNVTVFYVRSDGGVSDVPCPPVPDGCLVV